jgi:hypothetical protein
MSPATLAGVLSTAIFATSVLPMLWRAARTRDLSSYSLGHLVLTNAGNVVHSAYVVSLPPGPVWLLHGLYATSSGVMLTWKLRHRAGERGE